MQVAIGGSDGILYQTLDEKLNELHKTIASLVGEPKSEEEHVLENFHSSRTIRKLILGCPAFASTLWNAALQGKCSTWVQGYRLAFVCLLVISYEILHFTKAYKSIFIIVLCDCSSKVISAFLESSDSKVRELAQEELQPLINDGKLKIAETKQSS